VTTRNRAPVRGARRALALTASLPLALALTAPAVAAPEGWSDPDPVSGLSAVVVYLLAPLAVVAVTVALTLLPRWARAAKAEPSLISAAPATTGLDELLGTEEPAELEAPQE
jgi:hypothetical protein